ncbi:hypothetical protein EPO33_03195 [Patescibacteria group bacterium]|nr:MAG: hypothetical protein EPO33_03195 [Patescibacteria group bacterium]
MAYAVKLQQFEGPLDLLLQLIEREELPISEVSLAEVTNQYIEHLEHAPVPAEDLADFLVVAAKLLYIKSKILLPTVPLGLEEEGISLEEQLRMYKEYLAAAKLLEARLKKGGFSFGRERAPLQQGMFSPPAGVTPDRLAETFREVIAALEPVVKLPRAAVARAVSIQERIAHLKDLLAAQKSVSFGTFLRSAESTTDVVVSFLALLELIKMRSIRVTQDELFSEMVIEKGETPIGALIDVPAL